MILTRPRPRSSTCGLVLLLLFVAGCGDVPDTVPGDAARVVRVPPAEDLPRDRALRAGFLIVDGVYNSELMAPYDIFHHTPFHTKPGPGIEVFTVSPDGEPVVTFEGLTVTPHYGFDDAPDIGVLTSHGGAKSYDVAMHLVDHLFGEDVARGVGGGLLIEWPPDTARGITVTSERKGTGQ